MHIILQYLLGELEKVGCFMTLDGNDKGNGLRLFGYWFGKFSCESWGWISGAERGGGCYRPATEADCQGGGTTAADIVREVSLIAPMDEPRARPDVVPAHRTATGRKAKKQGQGMHPRKHERAD